MRNKLKTFKVLYYLSSILLFLLVVVACSEDEASNLEYPLVHTGEVTNITSSGATFSAKIVHIGNEEIVDHGFVWTEGVTIPTLESPYRKLLFPGESANGILTTTVSSAFQSGQKYSVRAYVRSKNHITYGNVVSFISLGSLAPKVEGFFPEIATWGDTIVISGKNFSYKNEDNEVKFGQLSANVISSEDTAVSIQVPLHLDTSSVQLSLSVFGNISMAAKPFRLKPPVIRDFSPKKGTYQTIVTLKGNYYKSGVTTVRFNELPAEIITISDTSVMVISPSGLPTGEVEVSVQVLDQIAVASQKFTSLVPVIERFLPDRATFRDTIIIYGENFSEITQENIVKFGEVEAEVINASSSQLTITVPDDIEQFSTLLSVTVKEQRTSLNKYFILYPPVIEDFSPKIGIFGDEVTIYGQYFNPVSSNNHVWIGNAKAEVINTSQDQLTFIIPDDMSISPSTISLNFLGKLIISDSAFSLLPPEIHGMSPNAGNAGSIVTISGVNFSPERSNNYVQFGSVSARIRYASPTTLQVYVPQDIPSSTQVQVTVAGNTAISESAFKLIWKQLADFRGTLRSGAVAFTIANKGYVGFGGSSGHVLSDLWEYDPENEIWSQKADIGGSGRGDAVAFTINEKGYVCTGYTMAGHEQDVWEYHPVANIWTQKSDFPGPERNRAVAFSIESKGYVGTGINARGTGPNNSNFHNDFWEYDPETDSWRRVADLPDIPRMESFAFSIDNKGYVGGGTGSYNNIPRDLWQYDPVSDIWVQKSSFDGNIGRKSFSFALSDKGYVGFGTYYRTGTPLREVVYTDEIWEYDPQSDRWKEKINFPGDERSSSVVFVVKEKAYIGLGWKFIPPTSSRSFNDFWQYDPEE